VAPVSHLDLPRTMKILGVDVRKKALATNGAVVLMAGLFFVALYRASRQDAAPVPQIFSLVAAHDADSVRGAVAQNHDLLKAVDLDGSTPLEVALVEGEKPLVDTLLDAGADVNVRNNKGMTPLFCAISSRNKQDELAILTKLLDHGADPNIRLPDGTHLLHILAAQCRATDPRLLLILNHIPDHPSIRDSQGRTPADIADTAGHHATADWLRLRIHD
jgi:ankyrin repeat protein